MGRRIRVLALCLLVASGVSQGESLIGTPNIYFGHLHNHSELSGAVGTPEQAYSDARLAGLDFFGLADHGEQLTTDEFARMKAAADAADDPDFFSAFYGFEWTSGTYGHVAVINPATFTSASNSTTDTFSEFMSWLSTYGGVAFFNHPGRYNSSGLEFEHFTGAYSARIVGMELWNRTSVLYYNSGYTSDSRDRSGHYDEALLEGWFIGAGGSEDNHDGLWGEGNYRLAVISGSNNRQAIYDALSTQCFYSTLDENLELSFQVDGHEMGSGTAGGSNQVVVKAADRDAEGFTQVEIIRNGYIVHTEYLSGATLPTVTCALSTQKGDYLYCKVTQTDGDEAFSSPVFITSDGPDGPPRADLAVPLDNGPDDLNPADDQVTVNTPQSSFQIQLTDFEGVDNDPPLGPETISIEGLTSGSDYTFAYGASAGVITLEPAGAVFGNGTYTITVSGIRDILGNLMPDTILIVRIDTSIVAPQTLHFQQGLGGYAGASDTMIVSGTADTAYPLESSLNVDTLSSLGGVSQVLLRFDSILGEAADQIPAGASVSSATLRLNSLDTGNGGHFHAMLQSWSDTSTWNSLTNGVTADGVEAMSVADASVGTNSIGYVDLNVTGTVQSWVNGTMANNGWAVLPNGTDGWHIASAEYGTTAYRPELIVTFVPTGDLPPVANAGVDQTVVDDDRDGVELVTLNGSSSSGSIVSYIWTLGTEQLGTTAVVPDVPFPAPGVYHVTLTVSDGSLSDTDEVVITVKVPSLFSDGFESGGFTAGGWVTSGQATVETTYAHSGTYGALLKKTSSMQTTIDTAGMADVTITYWARTAGLKAGSEYLYVEWSTGGAWQPLDTLTGATGWAQYSHSISPASPSFMIRFRTNGNAGSDMAMIDDIVVTGTAGSGNIAPSAADDTATTNEDSPVTISVLANDVDANGDTLSIASVTQGSRGAVAINGTAVTYSPNPNANGTDTFTYTASDGKGGTDDAVVTVTIAPVDDLPVAGNDTATTAMGTAVTINVLDNDSDVDGDPLSIISVTQPTKGSATTNGTTVTYTPVAGDTGTYAFTYTLAGGVTATVTVTVQGATPTMHVADLAGSVAARGNSSQWAMTVIVTVVNGSGLPVSGATVTGAWSGAVTGSATGTTGADGKVTLLSSNSKTGTSITFTVTSITHSSFTYDPGANAETSITVTKL